MATTTGRPPPEGAVSAPARLAAPAAITRIEDSAITGIWRAKASIFAAVTPTRMPVYDPGPTPTAIAWRLAGASPRAASKSRRCTVISRPWTRPSGKTASATRPPSEKSASDPRALEVSMARSSMAIVIAWRALPGSPEPGARRLAAGGWRLATGGWRPFSPDSANSLDSIVQSTTLAQLKFDSARWCTMAKRRKLIAGNWKMYKGLQEARALARAIAAELPQGPDPDVVICPPFPFLGAVVEAVAGAAHPIEVGAQNLYPGLEGAFTGEVSGAMIKSTGARYVIVGHSERRNLFGESDELGGKKVRSALDIGLAPILCVGERLEEREGGKTSEVVLRQLRAGLDNIDAAKLARGVIA